MKHAKNNKRLLLINFHLKESDTKERGARHKKNQRKTIVNSRVRCLENNKLVITSGFPTVNFRKW